MPTALDIDPATVNQLDTGRYVLGGFYTWAGRTFRFGQVYATDAIDVQDGWCAKFVAGTGYVVTPKQEIGPGVTGRPPFGVAVGGIRAGNYGMFLVDGIHEKAYVGTAPVAGNKITKSTVWGTGTEGLMQPTTVYTDNTVGVVLQTGWPLLQSKCFIHIGA